MFIVIVSIILCTCFSHTSVTHRLLITVLSVRQYSWLTNVTNKIELHIGFLPSYYRAWRVRVLKQREFNCSCHDV